MTTPKVFFSRCKPYEYDAVDVAIESKRLFFGYCMRRLGVAYDRHKLRSCIVDVACDDATWAAERSAQNVWNPQYNRNRNFVREIGPGSIALVPRPSSGVIYCGFVQGGFEFVDDPSWYDTWERIWKAKTSRDPDEFWIAGEVAQTFRVDEFRAIPVPRIPVWIRRSLFGRSTYGIVRPYGCLDPVETLKEILASDNFIPRTWTTDPAEVERRLITDVTPSAFEHLVVSLLQLEYPNEFWTHVGGSGDGGLDGIGADESGKVVGLLQCKWAYEGHKPDLNTQWVAGSHRPREILASAFHADGLPGPPAFEFLDKKTVSALLVKHATSLPQAKALRIGRQQ
ncbi:MAG: hypothetical protein V7704_08345 [Aurantimonas endophytica]|uniref:hypothetical protein n=1 Tax=Aurantimonas endophytica TaxID=1522175 RepID=UPI00300177F8